MIKTLLSPIVFLLRLGAIGYLILSLVCIAYTFNDLNQKWTGFQKILESANALKHFQQNLPQ